VEPPEVRARSGKPYFVTILIEVEEHPDELVVKVQDDGPGLDLEALKTSAERRGLCADEASTPMDAKDLAFLPGISTARRVDSLAGRGVGLEAARAAVELSGGSLELSTELGRCTTVLFRIPRGQCAVVEPGNAPCAHFGLGSDAE
jgi:two-component system chemotaxis sensor kinase CheA